jgi:hypothetical protein
MSTYLNHAYYTHQPYLKEIIVNTSGNILECGCGDGSTLFIRDCIKNTNRTLVSLESDIKWLSKFVYLQNDNHKLFYVDANNVDCNDTGKRWYDYISENLKDYNFEVVFIDSSPWLSRKYSYEYFKNKAKIIIIHDFDYFPVNNIIGKVTKTNWYNNKRIDEVDLSDEIKNYKLYYPPLEYFVGATGPPTLICSNILSTDEFNKIINIVDNNVDKYYK